MSSRCTWGTCARRSTAPSAAGRWRPGAGRATGCETTVRIRRRLAPRLRRLPVRLRLTLAFSLGMATVLAALGAFLYMRLATDLLNATDLDLRARAGVIVTSL